MEAGETIGVRLLPTLPVLLLRQSSIFCHPEPLTFLLGVVLAPDEYRQEYEDNAFQDEHLPLFVLLGTLGGEVVFDEIREFN